MNKSPDCGAALAAALDEFHRRRAASAEIDLDAFCAGHAAAGPALRAELEGLLAVARGLALLRSAPPAPAEATLVPGTRIGEFALLCELGRGGMGVVYEALQPALGRRVALKVLPAPLAALPSSVARFRREAEAAGRLVHDGIVRVHAAGVDEGRSWIAMEKVDGRPLAAGLRELRAANRRDAAGWRSVFGEAAAAADESWETIVGRCIAGVADALDHAHRHGVIHRDIKPSNLIVRPDGRAVLTDFGIARIEGQPGVTVTGELPGTPHYLAPEQLSGDAAISGATDLHALGVTLYEALALRLPFEAATTREVLDAILRREPPSLRRRFPSVTRDLETICFTALEKEPLRRYADAAAFATDLRRFLDGRPVEARPIGRFRRAARFTRRRPWECAAAGLALVLVGGVPTVLALVESRANERLGELVVQKDAALRARDEALRAMDAALGQKDVALADRGQALADALSARDEAERDRALQRGARLALQGLFRGLSQRFGGGLSPDHALPVREFIDRALQATELSAVKEPELVALAHNSVGAVLQEFGLLADAETALTRALELREHQVEGDDRNENIVRGNLAALRARLGRAAQAVPLVLRLLEASFAALPSQQPREWVLGVAAAVAPRCREAGLLAEAEQLLTGALDRFGDSECERMEEWRQCAMQLAELRVAQSRSAEAGAIYDRVESVIVRLHGAGDLRLLQVLQQRGLLAIHDGRQSEGEALIEESIARMRAGGWSDHPDVAVALSNLGWQQLQRGELDAAAGQFHEALAILESAGMSGDLARVGTPLENLRLTAVALAAAGEPGRAAALLERVVRDFEVIEGAGGGDVIRARIDRVRVLREAGEGERAEAEIAALRRSRSLAAVDDGREVGFFVAVADAVAAVERGESETAAALLREALALLPESDARREPLLRQLSEIEADGGE
ncbi:MAG: serine/threonine protein kinase [Planctomycetes bacterium]|nr:serine/threonine protein kinase [Planctomycetota bacterium]